MPGHSANINKTSARPRILVAPLDWGLGHATRCIPLIRQFRELGAEVVVAGERAVADLITKEFPDITILPLPGYGVRYSTNRNWFTFKLLLQIPRIISAIRQEHRWLRQQQKSWHFSGILSDNRYGMHHPDVPSVIVTHQLNIRTGKKWLDRLARMVNHRLISRFSACWVPDLSGDLSLAGQLSSCESTLPFDVKHIGPLSRMRKDIMPRPVGLLILISGPEPSRGLFETSMLDWLKKNKTEATVVLGKPGSVDPLPLADGIQLFRHLPAEQLNELIAGADMIIARCGYSTVMDLAIMGKKAVLVPTPGQQEQEYLASYLREKNWFACIREEDLFQYKPEELKAKASQTRNWNGTAGPGQVPADWLAGL